MKFKQKQYRSNDTGSLILVQLKMVFLLGYNLKIFIQWGGGLTFGGGGGGGGGE